MTSNLSVNAVKTGRSAPQLTASEWRACPICAGNSVEVLHHQRFIVPAGYILPDRYNVVWCPHCDFAFADTSASQRDYDRYYADCSKYEHNEVATSGIGTDSNAARLKETAQAVADTVRNRDARIVDIGCANGGLLAELRKCGFTNLLGIDPSPSCVANTERVAGVRALPGWLGDMPPEIGKFDLVMLSHVLEHVEDLRATLRKLSPLVDTGGLLYVEVPDASRYARYLVAPFQDFNTEHINHFHPGSLRRLLEANGFGLEWSDRKEIESSPGCPYPALFAFARPAGDLAHSAANAYPADEDFRGQLLSYIAASREKIRQIDAQLAPYKGGASQSLIVWGTGQLTMKLLAETALADIDIKFFVDGNPINQGKMLVDVPVLAPEQITDRETPILIATMLHHRDIEQRIREQLKLPNKVVTLSRALAQADSR